MPRGTWRRAVLTSLQGLAVQLLEVLPVGKFKPPGPPGAAYVHYPSQGGMKARPVDVSGQPWRTLITPDPHVVS